VVTVFELSEAEIFDVTEDREWSVERLESEKGSGVSESDVLELGGIGERCFAIFGGRLVEGSPTFLRLLFLVIVSGCSFLGRRCCGYLRARPHDNWFRRDFASAAACCGRCFPVEGTASKRWLQCWLAVDVLTV